MAHRETTRVTTIAVTAAALALAAAPGCTDVRDFAGNWSGPRVGETVLRTGFPDDANATLEIARVDLDEFRARLTITGDVFVGATIQELPAAEADVLSELTFESGQPARVFVTLVETADGGGDAVAFVSLHREDRIELRILRGGATPLYGIFYLARS